MVVDGGELLKGCWLIRDALVNKADCNNDFIENNKNILPGGECYRATCLKSLHKLFS